MFNYLFVNDGSIFLDVMDCASCGKPEAGNTELHINGVFRNYVCGECVKAAQDGGLEGWRNHLINKAEEMRSRANEVDLRASEIVAGASAGFELLILEDEAGDFTVAGPLIRE